MSCAIAGGLEIGGFDESVTTTVMLLVVPNAPELKVTFSESVRSEGLAVILGALSKVQFTVNGPFPPVMVHVKGTGSELLKSTVVAGVISAESGCASIPEAGFPSESWAKAGIANKRQKMTQKICMVFML